MLRSKFAKTIANEKCVSISQYLRKGKSMIGDAFSITQNVGQVRKKENGSK